MGCAKRDVEGRAEGKVGGCGCHGDGIRSNLFPCLDVASADLVLMPRQLCALLIPLNIFEVPHIGFPAPHPLRQTG